MTKYIIFALLTFMIVFQQAIIEKYDDINDDLLATNDNLLNRCVKPKESNAPDLDDVYYDD